MTRTTAFSPELESVMNFKVGPEVATSSTNSPVRRGNHNRQSNWYTMAFIKLNYLRNLESGWDGYRGKPVSEQNAYFALSMLTKICTDDTPAPHIIPGSGGDLQIEWHTTKGDIELNIMAPYKVNVWIDYKDHEEEIELTLGWNFDSIAEHVKKITE